MMEFNDNKPIYKQIVDYAFNRIISGSWSPGLMIPSVRELAADLGVNSRTVLKAMENLQDLQLIEPKRGMGFILMEDASAKVMKARRKEFFDITLPEFLKEIEILGIPRDELIERINSETKFN
ncbi:GntR family transcriptional regulator [uncultured Duncaniella sp.]|uniref:GntR family transcriptional regulator n=1 Tax=uncultured Duncaniella sp. TaxID=2768039 RepID=UPI0026EAA7E3|nr:GntR family transcriptional regulator [uncultured Duncaniella sp.]